MLLCWAVLGCALLSDDHNDDIDQLPISGRPSHQSARQGLKFELNTEGRMEGDDRAGQT